MGYNYGQRRGRGQELNVGHDDSLIGYALSDQNLSFEKHDVQDVADIVNRQLDDAERRLRRR